MHRRQRPVVIAHRGASGYLPEHTLESKALAFAMGADYLEQDVVATRDGELLVFHDLILDDMTDVARRFPGRARPDGSFYCIDFTLEEVRSLAVTERRVQGGSTPRFPGRFPGETGRFRIPTLGEELLFINGLMRSTGRRVGVYPEIKEPGWHRLHGIDLAPRMLEALEKGGFGPQGGDVFVQCFDADELQRLRHELGCRLPLVQLLDSAGGLPTAARLEEIAGYANAIGPSVSLVCNGRRASSPAPTVLVNDAHNAGLLVHPYTLRRDSLPTGLASFQEGLALLLVDSGADGVFTDFPDLAAEFVRLQFPA